MNDSPPLGNSLLVMMSNAAGSLGIVRAVVQQLSHPAQVEITIAHYLEPVLWEGSSMARTLESLFKQEETLLAITSSSDSYFKQGQLLFQQAGVTPEHIHLETAWNHSEIAAARKSQLKAGLYSAVIVAQHHYDVIYRLVNATLAEIIARHGSRAVIWIIDGYQV